jgi:hypothetical protein
MKLYLALALLAVVSADFNILKIESNRLSSGYAVGRPGAMNVFLRANENITVENFGEANQRWSLEACGHDITIYTPPTGADRIQQPMTIFEDGNAVGTCRVGERREALCDYSCLIQEYYRCRSSVVNC